MMVLSFTFQLPMGGSEKTVDAARLHKMVTRKKCFWATALLIGRNKELKQMRRGGDEAEDN